MSSILSIRMKVFFIIILLSFTFLFVGCSGSSSSSGSGTTDFCYKKRGKTWVNHMGRFIWCKFPAR